jgi:Undecaprenyl-phosphate glucose phosphotransferase
MLKHYHQTYGGMYRLTDAAIIGFAWIISYWLRFYFPLFAVTKGFPEFSTYAALTPFLMCLWILSFSNQSLYRPEKMLRRTTEAFRIVRAHAFTLILFLALTYLISEYRYSRGVIAYFGIISGLILVIARLSIRNSIRRMRSAGAGTKRTLLVGESRALANIEHQLRRFPEIGTQIVSRLPMSVSEGELLLAIREHRAEQILLGPGREETTDSDRILKALQHETIAIHVVPDLSDYVMLGCRVDDVDGVPIISLNDSPLFGWNALLKRGMDLVLSAIALLLLAPVYLLISLLIKLTSAGPILYKQERMGMDGRTFSILKFRSMRVDAESQGAVWARESDDRRTPIGAFLRSSSLDELPQFWNVFLGEMSLVGPRPERPVFVDQFRSQIPGYMLRHKVKAGITGWAQVNGWRGNTSLEKRIECDLYYIQNWSVVLDFKILLITVVKGFVHKNAY